jgi:hypothetical protein
MSDDPIHDWVYQEIPEKLWHYTSIQGFQGIIGSGKIYATDVRFLNDTAEFVHARKVANDLINGTPEFGDVQFPLRDALKSVVGSTFGSDFLNPNRAQIFVASFTDSPDDLSQWRGYSHGTCGVSIAFDLRAHRLPVESDSAVTFAPCVYHDEEKRSLIQSAFQRFLKASQTQWSNTVGEFLKKINSSKTKPSPTELLDFTTGAFNSPEYQAQLETELGKARRDIFRLSGLLKHHAFHHEREWRLVLPMSPDKDKTNLIHPIRFRSSSSSLIPYIDFPLGLASVPQGPGAPTTPVLPVNDVLLGPGATQDAINAAQDFLKSNSIKVLPARSDVPYRQA